METSQIDDKHDLRSEFFRMSVVLAIGHGTATTPLVYASSVLDPKVAYLCNGTLYSFMLLSSLLFAVPTVGRFGHRGSLVISLGLYSVYVGSFSLATMLPTPFMQGALFIPGSICAGLAAGILWTAQGGYFSHCGATIAREEKQPRELVNSQLATQFAFYYLLFEVLSKVLWSALMIASVSVAGTALLFVAVAMASSFAMTSVADTQHVQAERPAAAQVLDAVRLWSDVRIWLLSPMNITFGVSAAYMNGYFNAQVGSKVLGAQSIGYLSALAVLTSCAMTWVYGSCSQRFGNIVAISIGAASFAGIPILMLFAGVSQEWGWWICIFYVFQGSGRSFFENTNKAIFADTFKGADAEASFANGVMQLAASSALCFFLSAVVAGTRLAIAVLVFAILMPTLYIVKTSLDPAEASDTSAEDDPLLLKNA